MENKYSINKESYLSKNLDNIHQINDTFLSKIRFKEFGKSCLRFFSIDLYKKKLLIETDNLIIPSNIYISQNKKIKIFLDPKQNNFKSLENHFEIMDKFFSSDEVKKNLFGNNYDKYKYDPILKLPQDKDESDDESDTSNKKYNFRVKIKTDQHLNLKTWIIDGGNKCEAQLQNNESKYGGYSLILDENIKYKYIKTGTPVKIIFYYDFIWAQKNKNFSGKIPYGVNLVLDLLDIDNPNPEIYSKTFQQVELKYENNIPFINNINIII
ncbi:hypothetical protein ma309 [Moumouvirus australiensis]|uniref:Uncharacterized protein n=1 Tax=Moumouvirus australiensis TaxID=2109587 RepID=A0A2P1ELE6_9VIRU|nr:hypothetical protein QKC55_gp595 [Moumouvirus australiensis]AVL94695.1 hypothetical protein ma309 [Moumouvirus australiensis]